MKAEALTQAKERLARAQKAHLSLSNAVDFPQKRQAWSEFIIAYSTIYNKLEQGAKVNGKSMAWFGRVKGVRKTDQLLRYIQQVRNADEHGLLAVLDQKAEYRVYLEDPKSNPNASYIIGRGTPPKERFFMEFTNEATGEVQTVYPEPKYYLAVVQIKDTLHGNSFDPPTEHLGKPIEVDEPLGIATLALCYMTDLLNEAEQLRTP